MKHTITILLSLLLLLPAGAMAASTEPVMQGMAQGEMMMGGMIMLEVKTEDGVQGMVHLKDISEAMLKMGMKENFHFIVMFNDSVTGVPISQGTVALKITDPSGKVSEPLVLILMDGMFGADIALTERGTYRFTVGTKLADDKKRQFEFEYMLK